MRLAPIIIHGDNKAMDWSEGLRQTLTALGLTQDDYLKKLAEYQDHTNVNAMRAAMRDSTVSEAKFRLAMKLLKCHVSLRILLPGTKQ